MSERGTRRGLVGVALLAATLVPAIGTGQEYTDSTSVVVVEVPVNVTRDGEPVTGLTAEDFEITDEGKKQTISGFDVLDLREEGSAEQVRQMGVAARRHFIFVFDLSFSEPNAIARSRQAALDLVRTSLHPTDLTAVATYSNRRGPQVVLNFTADRRQVEHAFSTLGLLGDTRAIEDPLGLVVRETPIGDELEDLPGDNPGGDRGGLAPAAEVEEALARMEGESARVDLKQRVDIFTSTFGFLADLLAPLDGRKHVVFLSEGFDASALYGTDDQERIAEMQQAVEFGQFWEIDSEERFGSTEALGSVNDLLRRFREADATIHSIDISGLRSDTGPAASGGRKDGLFILSRETDGEFYSNYSDLSAAMGEMLERTSVTYVLAFQPSDPGRKRDRFHRLKVKLKDAPRGTKVSHREGYLPPGALGTLSTAQSNLRAAQQMHSGRPSDGIAARVLAMPIASGRPEAWVPVMLQIPASELAAVPLGKELPLEIYAYAMDSEGGVVDHFAEALTLDIGKAGEQLKSTGIKYFGHLDLRPGEYALRVMVRDGRTGSTSVAVEPLTVPAFRDETLTVLPPLFPESAERWVTVIETGERAAVRPVHYPFLFKGQSFVPAVFPVFQPEQLVAVSLMATRPSEDWLEVGSMVLGADGAPVPGTFLRVLERERDEVDGLERMIGAFEVPNLPSGEYELVVTMSDNRTGDVESGTLPFAVGSRSDASTFTPPPWMPDLSEIVSQLGPPDGEKIVKIDREVVAAGYHEALTRLAAHQQTGAVMRLTEIESSMVNPDNPMSSLAQIAKVEWRTLDQLAGRDPDLLLPALLLHKEAYSQYRLRKEPFLAVHARRMTLELIDAYADKAGSEKARRLASRVLTTMAAEVYSSGAHLSAKDMFQRAIDLDPGNGVARLGLGFMYETMGHGDSKIPQYADAARLLEEAVSAEPALHEARLRLAVNLGRTERAREAGEHLELLIDQGDVPGWIRSLAFQELARLHVEAGAWTEARRVLERGVEELPGESKLQLQLSYVYERTQQQSKAGRAAELATGESLSARYLYLQVPRLVEESSVLWTQEAEGRLPALAAALGPVSAGVGS